jgi:hypothetical protein
MRGATHVFAGPTIPHDRVRHVLPDAVVHGPVRHLSLLELPLAPGDTVAVIDGVFLQLPAIRHKELLHVLENGVQVWGASSMGALRAVELRPYGMRGVGLVQRLFALGVLERDDEVAVAHATAEADYQPLTMALVSIRVLARRARRRGLLTRETETRIVAAAEGLSFPRRHPETVVEVARDAGAKPPECATFLQLARDPTQDVKRQDAELLLQTLDAEVPTEYRPALARQRGRYPKTARLASWIYATRATELGGVRVPDAATLSFCQAFAADYQSWYRRIVLSAIATASGAILHCDASDADIERAALDAARGRGVLSAHQLLQAWLASHEGHLPPDEAAIRALVRTFRYPPQLPGDELALDVLRRSDVFTLAQNHVMRAQRLNAEAVRSDVHHAPERLSQHLLQAHLTKRWQIPTAPDAFRFALLDRGILAPDDFARLARPYLPYATLGRVPHFRLGNLAEDLDSASGRLATRLGVTRREE